MKKIIMLLWAGFFSMAITGQVVVNLQLPAAGLAIKSQLWNMTLSNTGTDPMSVKIAMIMTDVGTGQQVLSGSTGFFTLPPGNHFFQYGDVLPVNYVVLNSNYAVDASPDGFLPPGTYNICYEVLKLDEIAVRLTEECADATVESLSPPYLTAPDDLAEIEETRPVFSWLPPAPAYLLNSLSYNFKLVEILLNQTSSDAVAQNFPLVTEQNLSASNLVFPASQVPLDTGKTYAWQVVANNNGQAVSASEIWTFKVSASATASSVKNNQPYFKLKTTPASSYFICTGTLQLEYINELNDSTALVELYDESKDSRKKITLDDDVILLRHGQNLISIDLTNTAGIVQGHRYAVEITNSKKEVWKGRFLFKPTN